MPVVPCERGRHSAPGLEKVVCKSADNDDIWVGKVQVITGSKRRPSP